MPEAPQAGSARPASKGRARGLMPAVASVMAAVFLLGACAPTQVPASPAPAASITGSPRSDATETPTMAPPSDTPTASEAGIERVTSEEALRITSGPSWSPDGGRLAFAAEADEQTNIFLVDLGDRLVRQVTSCPNVDMPSWSPSGDELAVTTLLENFSVAILSLRPPEEMPYCSEGLRTFEALRHWGNMLFADWSPDGEQVVFSGNPAGADPDRSDLYALDVTSGGLRQLTRDAGSNSRPAWSPDGERIAFTSDRDGDRELYVMTADGGDAVRLTRHPGVDFAPSWSPDGKRLAFVSTRTGNADLFVLPAEGGEPVQLTFDPADDLSPAWSPDGTQIAFLSERDGSRQIFLKDVRLP